MQCLKAAIENLNIYNRKLQLKIQKENNQNNRREKRDDDAPKENANTNEVKSDEAKPIEGVLDKPDDVDENEQQQHEEIVLKEFESFEKKYVLCMDNLGEDREYTSEELKFIKDTAVLIKTSWEAQEKKLLLKDRDLRLEMTNIENKYKLNVSI